MANETLAWPEQPNILAGLRRVLGWSEERCAATAGVPVDRWRSLECLSTLPNLVPVTRILDTARMRGFVRRLDDNRWEVYDPTSPGEAVKIAAKLARDDATLLLQTAKSEAYGDPWSPALMKRYAVLEEHQLVRRGAERRSVIYDDGEYSAPTDKQRIRRTRLGDVVAVAIAEQRDEQASANRAAMVRPISKESA